MSMEADDGPGMTQNYDKLSLGAPQDEFGPNMEASNLVDSMEHEETKIADGNSGRRRSKRAMVGTNEDDKGCDFEYSNNDGDSWQEELERIWNHYHQHQPNPEDVCSVNQKAELDDALEQTFQLVASKVNALVRYGLNSFYRLESLSQALKLAQEDHKIVTNRLHRLRLTEEKQRKTIQDLMHSVEESQVRSRDASRQAVADANVRLELGLAVKEKNKALQSLQKYQAKCTVLEQQVHQLKLKLTRVTEEKIHLERDQRATLFFSS